MGPALPRWAHAAARHGFLGVVLVDGLGAGRRVLARARAVAFVADRAARGAARGGDARLAPFDRFRAGGRGLLLAALRSAPRTRGTRGARPQHGRHRARGTRGRRGSRDVARGRILPRARGRRRTGLARVDRSQPARADRRRRDADRARRHGALRAVPARGRRRVVVPRRRGSRAVDRVPSAQSRRGTHDRPRSDCARRRRRRVDRARGRRVRPRPRAAGGQDRPPRHPPAHRGWLERGRAHLVARTVRDADPGARSAGLVRRGTTRRRRRTVGLARAGRCVAERGPGTRGAVRTLTRRGLVRRARARAAGAALPAARGLARDACATRRVDARRLCADPDRAHRVVGRELREPLVSRAGPATRGGPLDGRHGRARRPAPRGRRGRLHEFDGDPRAQRQPDRLLTQVGSARAPSARGGVPRRVPPPLAGGLSRAPRRSLPRALARRRSLHTPVPRALVRRSSRGLVRAAARHGRRGFARARRRGVARDPGLRAGRPQSGHDSPCERRVDGLLPRVPIDSVRNRGQRPAQGRTLHELT